MTDNDCIQINSKLLILQRNEVLFTTQLENDQGQMQLQLIDIILMHHIMCFESKEKIIESFLKHPYLKYLAPSMTKDMVINILNNYYGAKITICTDKGQNQTKFKEQLKSIKIKQQDNSLKIKLEKKYKLSKNFALSPNKNGFKIWSSLTNRYYLLNIDEVITAVMYFNGCESRKIIKDLSFINIKKLKNTINRLISNKILIGVKDNEGYESSKTEIAAPKPFIPNSNPSWEHIHPDNRIPVYFVPHMENHFPLALGLLFSAIQKHDNGSLLKKYNLIPITYFTPEVLLNVVYRKFGKGIWLFSNYMWSIDLNLEVSKLIKKHDKGNITVHGGPSTPNYRQASIDFMTVNDSVDISVHGEGEIAIAEIFECIHKDINSNTTYDEQLLKNVTGITFKSNEGFIKNKERQRMEEPDIIPSPYLEGAFENYNGRVDAAIIESNRGCPFGCTFCDWGSATSQKVKKYDLERSKKEIEWIGKNQVKIIWIADANFGMYQRDIELAEHIIKIKENYGYPKEVVVNYTKNTTWRLAEIIKIFTKGEIISQGIISIQTTDKMTLDVINRKNIKTSKYDELAKVFADEKLPLSTDLMIGLPGITVDAFKTDLQRYMDMDVAIKAYPTQLLPNSPMADPEYISKHKIETDENDFIISSYSFSHDDLLQMKKLYKFYTIADGYAILRYVLRYLQWQYDIKSIDFLYKLMIYLDQNQSKYPHVTWGFKYFDMEKCMPGGWNVFYDEIKSYLISEYSITNNSELETVLLVNKLSMPDDAISYPLITELKHDFTEYFKQFNNPETEKKLLSEYKKNTFEVNDPLSMAFVDLESFQYDTHQYFWELHTPISRASSIAL